MTEFKPNGCGPTWLPKIIPDGPDGVFKEPCDKHDRTYKKGGGLKEKVKADLLLFRESIQASKNLPLKKRIVGYAASFVYLFFTLTMGFPSFTWKR